MSLARKPGTTERRLGELGAEVGRVLSGTSTVAPRRGDRRFADVAWSENPLLRRLVQLYLAAGQTIEQLVIDAHLEPRDRKRVQFFLENLAEALAPSNVPLVNPGSAKAVVDTAGLSLVRGGKQLAREMASAQRIPEMVARAFRVAMQGRPGPVVISLPEDILTEVADECMRVFDNRGVIAGTDFTHRRAAIDSVLEKVGAVNRLITVKADREDAVAYRKWLVSITDVVITAARSGDVLGFGGQLVTASEHNFRDRLVLTLQR